MHLGMSIALANARTSTLRMAYAVSGFCAIVPGGDNRPPSLAIHLHIPSPALRLRPYVPLPVLE